MPIQFQTLNYEASESFARTMDAQDSLRSFREKFHIPKQANGENVVYLTGNSLGLQPKTTRKYIEQELKDWETFGVEGHFHAKRAWMSYHELLTDSLANIVGAKPISSSRDAIV